MIGTNDLLKDFCLEDTKSFLRRIIKFLICSKVEILVLLTVPPVPRIMHKKGTWEWLVNYNNFIKQFHNGRNIYVLDVCEQFLCHQPTNQTQDPVF